MARGVDSVSEPQGLDWLSGGGAMGELIRSMDWSQTPLGSFEHWPQSLRTTVSLCLSSTFPILIAWGPERVQIYNDSYRPIAGELHPTSMGQRFNECWASALEAVGHVVDRAQQGEGSYIENLRMFLDRYGYLEEAFMTFSFSPIRDESGQVGGLFHPITEVTDKMLGERRTQTLRDLSTRLANAKTLAEAWQLTEQAATGAALDLPFLLFYQPSDAAREATLHGAIGLTPGSEAAPPHIALDASGPKGTSPGDGSWPIQRALEQRTLLRVDDLQARFGSALEGCGPYAEPPRTAVLLPIHPAGAPAPLGCLIVGVSPRRALDPAYQAFFESLSTTFTTALGNVRAYEQEQRRADELAALDRAKTAFFSNVSHEFRTPLTLILGPTEDALDSPDQSLSGAALATVHRNQLRLLKLVNSLLDFSRIEAGRVQASYEPSDLASLTADLASAFRSTVERAGLHLRVDCPPLPEPIWVDHEMWEKIVLNLISNAFKFTFEGEIEVTLRALAAEGDLPPRVQLAVRDTGTGIPEAELPRLFERFHRVEGARGRSYEGSGIGLALVQELVRLHGGTLSVCSESSVGTTFSISLPLGNVHLPGDRLQGERTQSSTATRAEAFVREADAWSETAAEVEAPPQKRISTSAGGSLLPAAALAVPSGRVLIADDNADMRAYVSRLLEGRFTIEAVSNGQAALEAARIRPPDLVLSDVMMPQLDGFGLLRELRADARLSHVPVILLSARAGDEAKVEGIRAGASDYLVKPFSARELLARVEGSIRLARTQARLTEVLDAMGDAFYVVDREWRFLLVNASHERLTGKPRSETLGRVVWDLFPEAAGRTSKYISELQRSLDAQVPVHFVEFYAPLDLWTDVRAYPTTEGLAVFFRDVTEEQNAQATLRRQTEFEQQLVGIVSHDLRNPLSAIHLATTVLQRREHPDERTKKSLARIASSTERATRLVRDLLDFTQARLGGGIRVLRSPLDLAQLLQTSADELRTSFPDRAYQVEISGDPKGHGDADRLAQIIGNLGSNAAKYAAPRTPITLAVRGEEPDVVTLTVHNVGSFIPRAERERLFEPMQRGVGTKSDSDRSIGLGLFIVRQIAIAHGGTVSVESSSERGTVFEVRLPRH